MTDIPPTQKIVTMTIALNSDPIMALVEIYDLCKYLERRHLKYDWEATP